MNEIALHLAKAKVTVEKKNVSAYLTNKTKRSDRLQFSGACGAIGAASADMSAESGAHFASATSTIQSHSAITKFNLASVSL